ncbi:ABC transporter permease [Roseivirga misakiensis]|uniref:Uncharacterized protein n=1 Tax=Roseivirga misakiensis TaxID=1563681 RepID=A0A1E5T039_9BACT|nr:ABC transporter permease [Roseivirga misakiensis]OEK04740.1 hypothetical protein BFP71_14935 [Roseivirga misakiensis]
MLKNYLFTTLRHIQRNKAFSLINLLGLSFGVAITLLVSFYVIQETSFNKGHSDKNRVFRLNAKGKTFKGEERVSSILPIPAGPALVENFPQIESSLRYRGLMDESLAYGFNDFKGLKVMSFEKNLFDFLDLELSLGDENSFLSEINSVVLSHDLAKRLFNEDNPLNKLVKDKRGKVLKVTGVMSESNKTHFEFDFIIPFKDFLSTQPSFALQWSSSSIGTYVKLSPDWDIDEAQESISTFLNSKQNPKLLERLGPKEYQLQPIADVYLKSEDISLSYGERKGDLGKVRLFSIVALAVLLMACINFINLSTAGHIKRSKEVGLRKVIGASRHHLVIQFLVESTFMASVAGVFAILFADLMLGAFGEIIRQDLLIKQYSKEIIVSLVGIIGLTGIVAGLYPAWYLSSFPSTRVLNKSGKNSLLLRNSLVVIQFTIAIVFIVGALVVSKQINFLKQKDVGFDIENLMYVELGRNMAKEQVTILNKLNQSPWVQSASWSEQGPMLGRLPSISTEWIQGDEKEVASYMSVSHEFIGAAGLRMIAGRPFESDEAKNHVIINESAAIKLGKENVLGEVIGFYGDAEIIGVVEDFHYQSLHSVIEPLILKVVPVADRMNSRSATFLLVRLNESNLVKGREALEAAISAYSDQSEINYGFLSGTAQRFYTNESKTAKSLNYAASFAILISAMGLLGLIISAIASRTKEFGIRKVLGASALSIGYKLSAHFLFLVFLSLLLSVPIVVYTMREWLSAFSYRINLSIQEFVVGALLVLLISFCAIVARVYKAAQANPIDSLRHD